MRAIVSEVPLMYDYSCCHNKARVDVALRVGMNVTVSVPSNKPQHWLRHSSANT